MSIVFIYALKEPDTGEIRYVGKTDNLQRRLSRHLTESRLRATHHRACWIRSLLSKGKAPIMEKIDEASETEWPMIEAAYIQFYLEEGCRLVNGTFGGGSGSELTVDARAKISAYNRQRVFSQETRDRIAAKAKGRKHSAEAKAKMSLSRRGKQLGNKNGLGHRHSLETIKRMSESKLGNKFWVGRKHSLETRAKMSAAGKARYAS